MQVQRTFVDFARHQPTIIGTNLVSSRYAAQLVSEIDQLLLTMTRNRSARDLHGI